MEPIEFEIEDIPPPEVSFHEGKLTIKVSHIRIEYDVAGGPAPHTTQAVAHFLGGYLGAIGGDVPFLLWEYHLEHGYDLNCPSEPH